MRLVCPNCEAKYEVPEDAIPDSGRDVQCASCGHAWFFMRPGTAAPAVIEAAPAEAEPAASPEALAAAEPEVADQPSEAPAAEPEPRLDPVAEDTQAGAPEPDAEAALALALADAETATTEPAAKPEAEAEPQKPAESADGSDPDPEDEVPEEPAVSPALSAASYVVDESVLTILREEAEREAQARRAEPRPLESQPELGIDAAQPNRQKTPHPPEVDHDHGTKPSARRDLLPDVEEINSTLRPSETAEAEAAATPAPVVVEPRGFRSGFLIVLTLAIIGAGVYALEPRISAAIPSAAGPLEAYVGGVDSLRLALDGLMRSATTAINGE